MSVCLLVCKVVIVNYGQTVRVFIFYHKIEWAALVLRILNLKGHQNNIIGSKSYNDYIDVFVHNRLINTAGQMV